MVSVLAAGPAQASGDEEIIIVGAVCGVSILATGLVAGGLALNESIPAGNARAAGNRFRANPTAANATAVRDARDSWRSAYELNNDGDFYGWATGLTGLIGLSACLGAFTSLQ